jgi:Ca-activated chloride channel family protein
MKLNHVVRKLTFLLIAVLSSGAAISVLADDFDKVVVRIQSQYKVKKTHIPFLGLANLAVKVVRPAGVKEFKLAVFDNRDFSYKPGDSTFKLYMRETLVPQNWGPLFQLQSNHDGTQTYIYSRPKGNDFQILVVNFSHNQATVVQTKVDPKTLAKWMEKGNGGGILDALNINGGSGNSAIGMNRRANRDDDDDPANKKDDNDKSSADTSIADKTADSATKSKPELRAIKDSTNADNGDKAETKKDDAEDPLVDKDAIKLSAQLVNLNVKVLDQSGRVLSGLQKQDFKIFEENISQEIIHFEPNTAPVKLVLLLDFSGSTEKKVKMMKKTAKKFVDSLNPGDQIAVAAFTRQFSIGSDFTDDHKLLKDRIDHLRVHGSGTAYYDAMWKSLNMFRRLGDSRQAIVVLTDGVDNAIGAPKQMPAKHPFADLIARIGEEDATIYPIYLDTEKEVVGHKSGDTHEDYAVAREQLQQIADQTGGTMFRAARVEDLDGVYQRVAAELHTLYTVTYSPNTKIDKGQWHRIVVRLEKPGTVARTRKGYFSR